MECVQRIQYIYKSYTRKNYIYMKINDIYTNRKSIESTQMEEIKQCKV